MDTYFAAGEASKLISVLQESIAEHERAVSAESGLGALWRRNLSFYYAGLQTGDSTSALDFGGVQGEVVKVYANQARSLARQFFALVTKNRLEFEAHAQTTDTGTLADARLSNALARHIVTSQQLDLRGDRMLEITILAGSAYLKPSWRTDRGRRVTVKDSQEVLTGDLEITVHHPLDVVFDTACTEHAERDWVVVRTLKNKWDLIAEFPKLALKIANLPKPSEDQVLVVGGKKSDDLCFVYEFYHRSTVSLPKGKLVVFADAETVFFDKENPYKDQDDRAFIPVVECKPEPIHGTPWGYTFFNDLVPLQEMFDASMSTVASNVSAYGLGTMLSPEGNGLAVRDIGGLQFLVYKPMGPQGGGKPEPMAMPNTPAEVYRFSETIKANMQEISGINSTLRGSPPSNVTSGTMAATLSANAVEFAAPFAKAYNLSLEKCVFNSILIYKTFAKLPQIISVSGKNKANVSREFVGTDIGQLATVSMKVRSALSSTSAGLSDQAEKMLKAGLIKTPQQFLEFMETGSIETLYEAEESENDLINAENDDLREGKEVRAMSTDVGPMHISQHRIVMNDPELRRLAAKYVEGAQNSEQVTKAWQVLKETQNHILEHLDLEKDTEPLLRAICATGQAPQNQAA